MRLIKKIIFDIKTYISINYSNIKRFPSSKVNSYVHPNLKIGKNVTVKEDCTLSSKLTEIGNGTYIGNGTLILNCNKIGNYCSISHNVKIGMDNHLLEGLSTSPLICKMDYKDSCEIENDVLISANVVIMSGVKIGNGAVIGANSFVNKDVPPYAIVAGTPAKIIRYRFDDSTILKLQASKWWEIDLDQIRSSENLIN